LIELLKSINNEGMVKVTLSILLLLSLGTLYIFFMDEPQRWFLFHGEDAEIYEKSFWDIKDVLNVHIALLIM